MLTEKEIKALNSSKSSCVSSPWKGVNFASLSGLCHSRVLKSLGIYCQVRSLTYMLPLNVVAEVRIQLCHQAVILNNNSTIHDQKYFSNQQLLAAQCPLSSGDAYGWVEYKVRLCAGAV